MANQMNTGGSIATATRKVSLEQRMADYDALPKQLREVISNAPYQLRIANLNKFINKPNMLKRAIKEIAIDSAIDTYGYNYPIEVIK
jgi:hypothetical protein